MALINRTRIAGAYRKVRTIPAGPVVTALAVLALAVALVASIIAITDSPAAAAPSWPDRAVATLASLVSQARPHHVVVQYNQDSIQMTCKPSQRGWTATVVGDGSHVFLARCEPDGPIYAWDAIS